MNTFSNIHLNSSNIKKLLIMLVSVDLVFIVLHVIHKKTNLLRRNLFSLTTETGHPEMYQYIKEFWIILLILFIVRQTKEKGFLAWALFFGYILVDDSMQIHERFGRIVVNYSNVSGLLSINSHGLGELLITFIFSSLLFFIIFIAYVKGSQLFRFVTVNLIILVLTLAFFGVFIDLFHVDSVTYNSINFYLRAIEDGGEMIVMSIITWYLLVLTLQKDFAGQSVSLLIRSVLPVRASYSSIP